MRSGLPAGPALLALILLSCTGKGEDSGDDPLVCPPEGTEATWSNHAAPFLDTWCTGCHHSELPADLRQGAPVGMDFDTWEGANAWSRSIYERVVVKRTMPPAGGPSDEGRELLGEWLSCELPGRTTTPKDPCDGAVRARSGSLTVSSAADLDTFCADYNAIEGDLVLTGGGEIALDCLCEVGGELQVWQTSSVSAVELPRLHTLGGLLVGQTAGLLRVRLPELLTVDEGVLVSANPALTELDLSALESVGAVGVDVVGNPALEALWLDRLFTVVGPLEIRENDGLGAISLDRILMVGDLVVSSNSSLERIYGDAYQLESVDGHLMLVDNPVLQGFYGFEELRTVGGDLVLEGNDAFEDFFGFTQLVTVGGHLWVRDHQRLGLVDGFDHLESVGGSVIVADNPVMRFVAGFRVLARVGLGTGGVDGLRLENLPQLEGIAGLDDLDQVGLLTVSQTALTGLGDLHGITAIEGGLTVTDNLSLPSAEVDALVAAVGVENIGGYVVNSGNAP